MNERGPLDPCTCVERFTVLPQLAVDSIDNPGEQEKKNQLKDKSSDTDNFANRFMVPHYL
jgi:hypothetical protein